MTNMFRFLLTLFLISALQIGATDTFAKKKSRTPAQIYYYPHIHKVLGGKGYKGMGGDMVFFSYVHTALEVLKNPRKYDIYLEGYSFDLYPGSRYRMYPRDIRKIKRAFRKGFPKHVSKWTQRQKNILLEFGPITVLFTLKKVRRIYAGDRWISKRRLQKRLNRCVGTKYVNAVEKVFSSRFYSNWREFYEELRAAQRGLSTRKCNSIFAHREKYLVKRLKRRRNKRKRPMLIIYGYSHDFGKYFPKHGIRYLGGPELQYAATCYHNRFNKKLSPEMKGFCASFFMGWLETLGHKKYFANALPASLLPDTNADTTRAYKRALQQYLKSRSPRIVCRDPQIKPQIRVEACTSIINGARKTQAKTQSKKHVEAIIYRADAYSKQFHLNKAIEDYERAVSLDPDRSNVFHKLGYLYYLKRIETKAIQNFKKSMALDPDNAENYHLLGLIYDQKDDFHEARKYFQLAVKNNPDNSKSLNNLAWALFKLKKPRKALPYVQKAIRLDPNSGASYDTRAHIYEALGRYRKALNDFRQALKIIPDSEITRRGLNRVKAKL